MRDARKIYDERIRQESAIVIQCGVRKMLAKSCLHGKLCEMQQKKMEASATVIQTQAGGSILESNFAQAFHSSGEEWHESSYGSQSLRRTGRKYMQELYRPGGEVAWRAQRCSRFEKNTYRTFKRSRL